ncbi:hypothetical protein BH23CHL4_BH23CHL4_12330 [soil metagenome]
MIDGDLQNRMTGTTISISPTGSNRLPGHGLLSGSLADKANRDQTATQSTAKPPQSTRTIHINLFRHGGLSRRIDRAPIQTAAASFRNSGQRHRNPTVPRSLRHEARCPRRMAMRTIQSSQSANLPLRCRPNDSGTPPRRPISRQGAMLRPQRGAAGAVAAMRPVPGLQCPCLDLRSTMGPSLPLWQFHC